MLRGIAPEHKGGRVVGGGLVVCGLVVCGLVVCGLVVWLRRNRIPQI